MHFRSGQLQAGADQLQRLGRITGSSVPGFLSFIPIVREACAFLRFMDASPGQVSHGTASICVFLVLI